MKKDTLYRGKKVLPFSNDRAVFMLFSALTVPSPHVCAINLPRSTAWKSQHTLPHVSLSHTHGCTLPYGILWPSLPHFPFLTLCDLVHLIQFSQLYVLYFPMLCSIDYIFTLVLSFCPCSHTSNWCKYFGGPPVSAQLKSAVVLNIVWLNWVYKTS